VRVAQVQGQSHNVTYPCQSVDPYRLRAATSAKDRRAEAAPNGGSTCGYAKTCSPRLVGRQRYARATTASSPGPGHCDCRDRARDGPLPIRPLPADTQFAQAMPELGRQHRYMGAAPNPRILTGWFGASSHGLRFPVRAFLRFPVCPAGFLPFARLLPVSRRPAFSGSVPSAVAVRFGSPSVPLRFPSPSAIPTLALPRACPAGIGPARPGPTSPVPARSRAPRAPVRPQRKCSPGAHRGGAPRQADGPAHHHLHLGSRDDRGS